MLEEVSMEKQKDQEFAHLEVKRLCGVFGAPLPPVEEKPVDNLSKKARAPDKDILTVVAKIVIM